MSAQNELKVAVFSDALSIAVLGFKLGVNDTELKEEKEEEPKK